jgi:bacteriorhodopsin
MTTILTLGVITFAISSLYFTIKPKEFFNSAFLVSFITLISYLIMLQGGFVTNDLYWTRWFIYGISCPLLAFEISKNLGLDLSKRIFNVFLTIIVMLTGALSSINEGNYKLAFFIISSIAFCILILEFYKTKSKMLKSLTPYIIFGWCVFPLVFILSNEGMINLIPLQIAAAIYLALDIFTKIIFYINQSTVK